jgi:hypothetical protein
MTPDENGHFGHSTHTIFRYFLRYFSRLRRTNFSQIPQDLSLSAIRSALLFSLNPPKRAPCEQHLPTEFRCVGWSRLRHRGLLEHKCSGVHETGSTPGGGIGRPSPDSTRARNRRYALPLCRRVRVSGNQPTVTPAPPLPAPGACRSSESVRSSSGSYKPQAARWPKPLR